MEDNTFNEHPRHHILQPDSNTKLPCIYTQLNERYNTRDIVIHAQLDPRRREHEHQLDLPECCGEIRVKRVVYKPAHQTALPHANVLQAKVETFRAGLQARAEKPRPRTGALTPRQYREAYPEQADFNFSDAHLPLASLPKPRHTTRGQQRRETMLYRRYTYTRTRI